jgi:hypothetical protein
MNFLAGRLLLRSLNLAEAGAHPVKRHCHDLGEGRHLCHDGRPGPAPPRESGIVINIPPGDNR